MIKEGLKVLLLEDKKTDQELVKRQVRKIAPSHLLMVADSRSSFFEKLNWTMPDIILADYSLPDFNGLEALLYVKEKMPLVPFIFVTGTLFDEEKVAETILTGASAYLLKQNLTQLPELMEQVLTKAAAEIAVKKFEEQRLAQERLLIQKAIQALEKAPNFEGKEETQNILRELLASSINKS